MKSSYIKYSAISIILIVLFALGSFATHVSARQIPDAGIYDPTLEPRPTAEIPKNPTPTTAPAPTTPPVQPASASSEVSNISVWLNTNTTALTLQQQMVITVLATNNDTVKAKGTGVRIPMPTTLDILGMTTTKGTVNINPDNNTIKANFGALKPGESASVTLIARANASALKEANSYVFAVLILKSGGELVSKLSNGATIYLP